jgi:hypothetical protein
VRRRKLAFASRWLSFGSCQRSAATVGNTFSPIFPLMVRYPWSTSLRSIGRSLPGVVLSCSASESTLPTLACVPNATAFSTSDCDVRSKQQASREQ